jgi:hypothetical protein
MIENGLRLLIAEFPKHVRRVVRGKLRDYFCQRFLIEVVDDIATDSLVEQDYHFRSGVRRKCEEHLRTLVIIEKLEGFSDIGGPSLGQGPGEPLLILTFQSLCEAIVEAFFVRYPVQVATPLSGGIEAWVL